MIYMVDCYSQDVDRNIRQLICAAAPAAVAVVHEKLRSILSSYFDKYPDKTIIYISSMAFNGFSEKRAFTLSMHAAALEKRVLFDIYTVEVYGSLQTKRPYFKFVRHAAPLAADD